MDRRLRADAGSSSCIRRARCRASESLGVNEIAEECAVEEITRTRRRPATLAERIFRPLDAQSRIGWGEMEIRSGKSGARTGLVANSNEWTYLGEIFALDYRVERL